MKIESLVKEDVLRNKPYGNKNSYYINELNTQNSSILVPDTQTQGNINLESPKSYIDYQYNLLKYAETPNALAKSPEIRSVLNELKEEINDLKHTLLNPQESANNDDVYIKQLQDEIKFLRGQLETKNVIIKLILKNTEDINNHFFTQNPEQPNKGDKAISNKNELNSNESIFIKPKKFTKAKSVRQNDFYSKNPFNILYIEDSPDTSDENDITHAENQIQEKRE